MKLNDVGNDVQSRMKKIQKTLKESYGVDVTKSKINRASVNKRIKMIENSSGFSKQHKNSEWKRLSLVSEYMRLSESTEPKSKSLSGHALRQAKEVLAGNTAPVFQWNDLIIAHPSLSGSYKTKMTKIKNSDQYEYLGSYKGVKAYKKKSLSESNTPKQMFKKKTNQTGKMKEMKVKENAETKSFVKLMESELERAEIVLASRSIVDELQGMIETLSKTKVEELSPLVDRIKAEFGLAQAEAYNQAVASELDSAIEMISGVKDTIDTESLKLSGDVSETEASSEMGTEDDFDDEMGDEDLGDDFEDDMEDDFGDDMGEPEELDRELKESITLQIKSITGKNGRKTFNSRKAMKQWVNENASKIKTLKRV